MSGTIAEELQRNCHVHLVPPPRVFAVSIMCLRTEEMLLAAFFLHNNCSTVEPTLRCQQCITFRYSVKSPVFCQHVHRITSKLAKQVYKMKMIFTLATVASSSLYTLSTLVPQCTIPLQRLAVFDEDMILSFRMPASPEHLL